MAEPLKNYFNLELVKSLSRKIAEAYPDFNIDGFVRQVFDETWEAKELKQRMRHISESLHDFLPGQFSHAVNILKSVPVNAGGFEYMFLPDYVELYGLESFKESISALEHFTPFASAEFAVRPFIKKYGDDMMNQMESWAVSDNPHVRRLASEGCRPRTDGIVKHGCRTLLKQGNPEILALFGYEKPKHIRLVDFRIQDSVVLGGKLNFSFTLKSERKNIGTLRIEYGIKFLKKNGSHSIKVFKLSESENVDTEKIINRFHSFKKISTRTYYYGMHGLSIIVNGQTLANADFVLRPG